LKNYIAGGARDGWVDERKRKFTGSFFSLYFPSNKKQGVNSKSVAITDMKGNKFKERSVAELLHNFPSCSHWQTGLWLMGWISCLTSSLWKTEQQINTAIEKKSTGKRPFLVFVEVLIFIKEIILSKTLIVVW